MKKYFDIIKMCPLFTQIEKENLFPMLSCLDAKIESFDKKHTILAEGSSAKYIGIVLSGSARIIQIDFYGNRSILANVMPSEIFSEAFACAGISSLPVSIVANEPCEVMLIDCNRILHTCTNSCCFHQQMIFNLMKILASKTIMFHRKIEIISKRSTREKLMTYLKHYAKETGSSSFDIPFSRQELADYLEVDRSGLSAEISKLRNLGVISCRKNHFVLL